MRYPSSVLVVCLVLSTACAEAVAPNAEPDINVIAVQFSSVAVPGTSAATSVVVPGRLYLPAGHASARPAVVILPSSSGVQPYRELYYARAFAEEGFVSLVVESFQARGVISAVEDQSAITSYQLEVDAFGALQFLQSRSDVRHGAVALFGVSKGGTAALNSAFLVRERWRGTSARFAAHASVTPACGVVHRSLATTQQPLFLLLAQLDDYAPASLCVDYAAAITNAGSAQVRVQELAGVGHGWEQLTPAQFISAAENFGNCVGVMEDSGRIAVAGEVTPLSSDAYTIWARANCVVAGAHTGGGSTAIRDSATHAIVQFLRTSLVAPEEIWR